MCFAQCCQCQKDPKPLYDDEGALNEEQETDLYIAEGVHEHVDSIYLNFDFEDGILGFIYENANGVFIVWPSSEAEQFGVICEVVGFNILEYVYSCPYELLALFLP